MGLRSFVKNTVKNNTNIKGWASWDAVRAGGKVVGTFFDDLKSSRAVDSVATETFEEMMTRLNLSPANITARMQSHKLIALFCALLGVGGFIWMGVLLSKGMFLSSLMAFSLAALMFAYAFQEHLHYFRLKRRQLHCTVRDWFFSFFRSSDKG